MVNHAPVEPDGSAISDPLIDALGATGVRSARRRPPDRQVGLNNDLSVISIDASAGATAKIDSKLRLPLAIGIGGHELWLPPNVTAQPTSLPTERLAPSQLTLAALPTAPTETATPLAPPTPLLPAVSTEPLATAAPRARREGWWRRTQAALRPAPGESQTKLAAELLSPLRRPLAPASAPYVVATVSLKGGVGKTTVAACLGLALSRYRADRVLAADLNLHAGTLAERLLDGEPHQTVQHLLDDLLDDDTPISAVGDIDRYLGIADRLSVLAGHKDPSIGAAFAEDDVAELLTCLGRFFHAVVADCGTGIADEAMQAVLRETDTLVLVATPTPDAAGLAEETLTWLAGHGYARLAENSIAVLNGPPTGDLPKLRDRFRDRCRAVIDIPADAILARGRVITLDTLAEDTRHAYLALAAAVVDAAPGSGSAS